MHGKSTENAPQLAQQGLLLGTQISQNEHRQNITRNSYQNSPKRDNSQHVPKMEPNRDSLYNQKLWLFDFGLLGGADGAGEPKLCPKVPE